MGGEGGFERGVGCVRAWDMRGEEGRRGVESDTFLGVERGWVCAVQCSAV